MSQANSALSHANGVLRAHHLPLRLRAGHNTRWVSVYENLCFQLISQSRKQPDAALEQLLSLQDPQAGAPLAGKASCWPEICEAVVAFQRRQGVNMNLVGPFKGQGYFRLGIGIGAQAAALPAFDQLQAFWGDAYGCCVQSP